MVGLSVVCPVCGTHEELEVRTAKEVKALLTCAIPPCPVCGWWREEDRSDPSWERLAPVYAAAVDGRDIKQGWLDELVRGPP